MLKGLVLVRVVDYAHRGLLLWQVMTSPEDVLEDAVGRKVVVVVVVEVVVVVVEIDVVDDDCERKSDPSRTGKEDYGRDCWDVKIESIVTGTSLEN